MKDSNETRGRPGLREELKQAVKGSHKQNSNEKPYQVHEPLSPYVKTGLYLTAAFVLVWASQYALGTLAGVIRQYKNLKRAIRE